jgi:hypothetical protein
MAFTNFLPYTDYGYAQTLDNKNGGWQLNVGAGVADYRAVNKNMAIVLHQITPAQTFNTTQGGTITVNTIIEIFPYGLNQKSDKRVTDSTYTQLQTAGW